MELTLSIKNYHRAETVYQKAHPELGAWQWNSEKKEATRENETVSVAEFNLSDWGVLSWKYDVSLEHLYEAGVRAFSMTSFSAEKRSIQYIQGYEADLVDDLKALPADQHQEYIERYTAKVADLFAKHSRCASAMITGPARFPTARNKKANDTYDKAVEEFHAWRESYRKRAKKLAEAAMTQEERDDAEFKSLRMEIIRQVATIRSIDNGTDRGYMRSAFVNSIYGRLERIAYNGKAGLVQRAIDLITELQKDMKKPVFTSRHKFWRLPELCQKQLERTAEREAKEDVELEFDGGKVVKCYSEDRLQIYHDEKPSRDVINHIKSNGFRWSPSNGCWQRQLNENGYYAAARVLAGASSTFDQQKEWIDKIRNAK